MAGLGIKVKRPKYRMGLIPALTCLNPQKMRGMHVNALNESIICYTLLVFSPIFCFSITSSFPGRNYSLSCVIYSLNF